VAQSIGPEFKSQFRKKKNKKTLQIIDVKTWDPATDREVCRGLGLELAQGRDLGTALEVENRRKGSTSSPPFALIYLSDPETLLPFSGPKLPTLCIRHNSAHPHIPEVLTGQRSCILKPNPSQSYRPSLAHYDNNCRLDQREEDMGGTRTAVCPYTVANLEMSGAWVEPINWKKC
jgi:hypothetical protein